MIPLPRFHDIQTNTEDGGEYTVWRFNLPAHEAALVTLDLPVDAERLAVDHLPAYGEGWLQIWFRVPKGSEHTHTQREFVVCHTGQAVLRDRFTDLFIGTVVIGKLVYHVFERFA